MPSVVDIRIASSMKARPDRAVVAFVAPDRLPFDPVELQAENARLSSEVERLRDENKALRESAEIWIRMYENQLSRANRASELLAHYADALPR
jgi:hypothetical protein